MSIETRLANLEKAMEGSQPLQPCQCTGRVFVTVDPSARLICNKCGGGIPKHADIKLPPGAIPAPLDEFEQESQLPEPPLAPGALPRQPITE